MDTLPPTTPATSTDHALVTQVLAGEPDALERLMRTHNRRLFRTARGILHDDAEAEDAVQDGYIRAYRALGSFRGESSLATWLTRIVVNQALSRRRGRAPAGVCVADDAAAIDRPAPASESPEAVAMRRQLHRLIESSIDRLPDGCRAVFMLREVEGLGVAETALSLDLSQAAVKTALFRARQHLRESIGREIGAGIDDFFAFDGARCDRLVVAVHRRLGLPLRLASPG
ncbi:MAG: RNA polymerase sigma factor [Rhodocyclaceae bacterium]|nr:RNA polymerase sigma factor [Rhodocyclaceae bacterium]